MRDFVALSSSVGPRAFESHLTARLRWLAHFGAVGFRRPTGRGRAGMGKRPIRGDEGSRRTRVPTQSEMTSRVRRKYLGVVPHQQRTDGSTVNAAESPKCQGTGALRLGYNPMP